MKRQAEGARVAIVVLAAALVFFLAPRAGHGSEAVRDCDAPSQAAITRLPEPIDAWAKIDCSSRYGYFLGPPEGHLWVHQRALARGRIVAGLFLASIVAGARGTGPEAYFRWSDARKEEDPAPARELYRQALPGEREHDQIWSLSLTTNEGRRLTLFFYLTDAQPDWVIGCIDQGEGASCERAMVLKVVAVAELQAAA